MAKCKIAFKLWFPALVVLLLGSLLLAGCSNNATTSSPEPPPPSAPTNLSAVVQGNTIKVAWDGVSGAISYTLYWSTSTGVTAANITAIPNASNPYTFDPAKMSPASPPGTVFFFAVTAVGPYGESAPSAQIPASVPAAPTGVSVAPGNDQATITWTAVQGAASYNIYYSSSSFGDSNKTNGSGIVTVTGVTTPYTQTGLTNGNTYYFDVTAVNAAGESLNNTVTSGTTLTTPSGVSAAPGDGTVTVSWQPVTNATSYNLYWSTPGMPGVTKVPGVTSPFSQPGTNGTAYAFTLTAVVNGVESAPSTQVSAKPVGAQPPAAPTGVAAAAGDGQVTISWQSVTGETSYNLYWSTASGVTPANGTVIAGVTNPHHQTGLSNGVIYYYVVTAVNGDGESPASIPVSATPAR